MVTPGRNSLATIQDEDQVAKMPYSVKQAPAFGISSSINNQKEYFLSVTWEPHTNSASAYCLFTARPRTYWGAGKPRHNDSFRPENKEGNAQWSNAMWGSTQSTAHFPETCLGKYSNAVFSVFYLSFWNTTH